jgi:hypothetical protein
LANTSIKVLERLSHFLTGQVAYDPAARAGSRHAIDAPAGVNIRLPGPPDDPRDRVIRPALFVLFRIATGPSADYYGPRFVAFERAGHPRAGWHWPALFAPAVWAFYRKLWIAGVVFALLPLVGAHAMALVAPWLDDFTWMWLACALLLTIVVPSISGAALANALLYRRVRRRIRSAEADTESASQAASRIGGVDPVSPYGAVLLGTLAVMLLVGGVGPVLFDAYREHAVRVKVGKALVGVAPIKEQIEDSWAAFQRWPRPGFALALPARAGAVLFNEVVVDPATGRVKLDVGPSIPELGGKAILLVPTVDDAERVRWFCIPVGIPDRYLPQVCRKVSR